MPFSRSRSFESMARSSMCSCEPKEPVWRSIASTRVVLPWSTCATIATLRRSGRRARAMRESLQRMGRRREPALPAYRQAPVALTRRRLSGRSAAPYSGDSCAARSAARASRRTRCSAGSGTGTAAMSRCVYASCGCAQDLPRRALLDDAPVVHHDDAVGERVDDGEVVADEQAGEAEVALQVGAAARGRSPAPRRRARTSARRR